MIAAEEAKMLKGAPNLIDELDKNKLSVEGNRMKVSIELSIDFI